MVNYNIPITLVRVSEIDRDLEKVIKSSNIAFSEFLVGNPLNKKYVYLDEKDKCTLMVSKNLEEVNPDYGYNFIITIVSYSNEQNEKIANDFQDKTGIELKKAPKDLEETMNEMNEMWAEIL